MLLPGIGLTGRLRDREVAGRLRVRVVHLDLTAGRHQLHDQLYGTVPRGVLHGVGDQFRRSAVPRCRCRPRASARPARCGPGRGRPARPRRCAAVRCARRRGRECRARWVRSWRRLSCFQPEEWYGAAGRRRRAGAFQDIRWAPSQDVRLGIRTPTPPNACLPRGAPAVTGLSRTRDSVTGNGDFTTGLLRGRDDSHRVVITSWSNNNRRPAPCGADRRPVRGGRPS